MNDLRRAAEMALEALEKYCDQAAIDNMRQSIEQAEKQEPDLPPVFIGVDVTLKGTQVNAFYRRPNDVAEMFYSEFHPLAKPEQEPVAWVVASKFENQQVCWFFDSQDDAMLWSAKNLKIGVIKPLYTAPPKQWVGLTDEEMEYIWGITPEEYVDKFAFARAVEAKLKEKNA